MAYEEKKLSKLSNFSRAVCIWAVNSGMKASRLRAADAPDAGDQTAWGPRSELGARIVAESTISMAMQGKIELSTGRVCGFEAFASPVLDGKRVPASDFVPAIESAKLHSGFDWLVLAEGFRVAAKLRAGPATPISFNVSPVTISEPGFASRMSKLASQSGVDLRGIKIEVLERMPLDIGARARMKSEMKLARAFGFEFSIDDFGSGDADCAMLELPAGEMKIDAFYVAALDGPDGAKWIASMVKLAKSNGMSVCAEGVEHEWQAAALAGLGVDVGQGYLWRRPLEAEEAWGAELAAAASGMGGKLSRRRSKSPRQDGPAAAFSRAKA